jgi:hypothetical protein
LNFVAELGVHQHPCRGTLEINRPRQLDKPIMASTISKHPRTGMGDFP